MLRCLSSPSTRTRKDVATYAEVYIVEAARARWHEALLSLRGADTHLAATGMMMYQDVTAALADAPQATNASLSLCMADLELIQADARHDETAGGAAAQAAAVAKNQDLDKRAWLGELRLRDLCGADGRLGNMARRWEATHYAGEGVPEGDLDGEEISLGIRDLLAASVPPHMLRALGQAPGGPSTTRRFPED
ncbi:MAG: hypothetical protein SGPRY_014452 [Prymnesium sp.]